ncbi:MAG: TatD family hydrolase [Oscillospiraceae bacterium]|nr:TatD family hydrolase [Oscillospiraceae bacterium]
MIFDTHAHYDDSAFDEDRDDILKQIHAGGVELVMNACADIAGLKTGADLAEKYPFVYISAGVHPHDVSNMTEEDIELIRKAAANKKVRSIGEIGLDYYYDNSPRELQKKWFLRQTELARELSLPVMIHDRDAHRDTIDILRHAKNEGGVFHCFSGSKETAREALDMDMYIAIGGSVTFKNSKMPKEIAAYIPLDRMVVETDSPYLTPVPHRGKRNYSLYLKYVTETIAQIRGISADEVERATFENGRRLFGI